MGDRTDESYKYSLILVVVLGILGNVLVIVSILRHAKLTKTNYYFLVLHLAICDLKWLLATFVYVMNLHVLESPFLSPASRTYCLVMSIAHIFEFAGVYMMLIISVLRYHATIHPLQPDISQERLRIICGLGYTIGLIVGYGTAIPECFVQEKNTAYWMSRNSFALLLYCAPVSFMAVVYYRICRSIMKQNNEMKILRLNPTTRNYRSSSISLLKYIRNRRTSLVCLCTVCCYGVGNLPLIAYFILRLAGENDILMKYTWIPQFAAVFRVAGTNSVNPLIYGIFDKKLLAFLKRPSKSKKGTNLTATMRNETFL